MSISSITDVTVLQKMIEDNKKNEGIYLQKLESYKDSSRFLQTCFFAASGVSLIVIGGVQALVATGYFGLTKVAFDVANAIAALVYGYFITLWAIAVYRGEGNYQTEANKCSKIAADAQNRINEITAAAKNVVSQKRFGIF